MTKPVVTTYKVTLQQTTGGTISANYAEAEAGTTITLSYDEYSNYDFAGWTVRETGGSGSTVTVSGNTFEMPASDVTVSARFDYDPPYVPPVYYTVTLPAVEGATTDPVAGDYEVESWGNFRFSLTLDEAYNQSVPVVTTDRGETLTPNSSGYYVVKYVRDDVVVSIDGIEKNPDPVANEAITADGFTLRTAGNCLYIYSTARGRAAVYDFNGKQLKRANIVPGETRWAFPSGIYIVEVNGKRYKVML